MDILVIRSISRIVIILCGISAILYGIILINSTKEDQEKTEAAHKKCKSLIGSGVIVLLTVVLYSFL